MSRRSDCPIANILDLVGDKWSFLILRDMLFFGKRSFSDLKSSEEKVATNILTSRLEKLEHDGLIVKHPDPSDGRKKIYSLTQQGRDTLPIMLEMMIWSSKYDPDTNVSAALIERAINDRHNLINDLLSRLDTFYASPSNSSK